MRTPRLLPPPLRAVGIVCAVAAMAACDDDGGGVLDPGDECAALSQTAEEIEEGRSEGKARVRINVVSRLDMETPTDERVSLNGAQLYVGDACYRLGGANSLRLADLGNDMGTLVAEASVDPGDVTHLLLDVSGPSGGRTYSSEKLELEEAVRLQRGGRTDIYLALSPVGTTGNAETRFVAAGTMPWDAETMVFDPVRGGAITLPNGFKMEMPAGSVRSATVFGVNEVQSGDVSATWVVSPEQAALEAPARVTFPIDRTKVPVGMGMADYGGRVNGAAADMTVDGNTATITAGALGQIRLWTDRPYYETTSGQRLAAKLPAPSDDGGFRPAVVDNECYRRLLADRAAIMAMASQNYGVKTNWCENTPPYVHILIVNLSRAGLSAYPKIHFPARRQSGNVFELQEISTHLSTFNDFAAINGFTWTGDRGFEWGGTGTLNGTVYMNYERVSPWYGGSEVIVGFGPYNPTYGTPTRMFERVNGSGLNIAGYDDWMVPSTTSVIKGGACTAPLDTPDRWSALGIGNGVLVMASSVSYTTTSSRDLCSVFEGLNVMSGALRLDGGSASGIAWLGNVLNPLTGGDFTAFGNERHIAYAIAGLYP